MKATINSFDDLGDWRVFIKVCSQKSLSSAAESMGMTTSTVSRRISSLEDRLKVKLLYRSPHKIELTPKGEEYFGKISQFLIKYDTFLNTRTNSISTDIEDVVVISASPCFQQFVIGSWCLEFRKTFPKVRFKTVLTQEALNPVASGIDIAIHSGPTVRTVENAEVLLLGQLTASMAASPAYVKKYGMPQNLEELKKHTLMHYCGKMSGEHFRLTKEDGTSCVFRFTPALESTSTVGLIRPALEGRGILMYACDFMLHREFADGSLLRILPEWKLPLTHVTAVPSPYSLHRRAVRSFLQFMIDHWEDVPGFLRVTPKPSLSIE